ncbi:MAG TPA: toll/interleukin-1 receptor domain-containing protein [Sphingomicrobium sp.]|nr:toll/interleukin-1 receptor domain-containing protein [Sphingomicrobium sp.]
MASVFLSYSREDVAKAQVVAAALERHGHKVWWDRQLHGGSRFSKEIEQALKGADAVVVLWSRSSIESAWVQDEAAEGRDSGRLVPLLIDDSKPPLGFRQFQTIDLSGWKGRPGGAIKAVHEAILAKGGQTAPAAAEPRAATAAIRNRRPVALAAIAIVAILMAGLAYWLVAASGGAEPTPLRLQLGEFKALSREVPEAAPETLREELLAALATDSVIVATTADAPSSSSPGYALSATVRNSGDELLFTIHVTNPESGAALWSETLARPAAIAEIAPRQAAVGVSQVLRCGLGGAARYGKPMPDETLSVYLSFCEEYWSDTMGKPGNATRALDLARRVVALAPDFSRGWSGLGQVAIWSSREGRLTNVEGLRSEARKAAERAIDLDGENSQAYEVLAILEPPFAFAEREKLHLKSVTVRPGDCGCEYVGYGAFLSRVGRNAEAVDAFKRAHDMIPLSADVNAGWADALFVAGRADEAQHAVDTLLELWPDNPDLRESLIRSAFWTRRYDEALRLLDDPRTAVTSSERESLRLAFRALKGGGAAARTAAARALVEAAKSGEGGSLPIVALGALGANAEALAVASAQIRRDGPRGLPVLFQPPLAAARHLPQFADLAQRHGLVSYWKGSGKRPDFCKEKGAPALCGKL